MVCVLSIDETQITLLSERLGSLLGFSDGVDDVVRNLLTIESRPDLLDYLIQLLGSDRQDQLRDFVDDVCRVQRGEVLPKATTVVVEEKKVAPKLEVLAPKQKQMTTPKVVAAVETKSTKQKPATNARPEKTPPKKAAPNVEKPIVVQPTAADTVPAPPQRGTASTVCGCFGTLHRALSNCLQCGRISCEREGYGYCAFCGYLVEDKATRRRRQDLIDEAAWELQERLLSYDRQFVQRTVVVDDQADHHRASQATWLNETEQQEAAEREVQRYKEVHQRAKMTLDLDV